MRLAAFLPFGDAYLAGQHAGFDADERNRLRERKRGADLFPVFARLQRRGRGDVFGALLRGAEFMNGREAEIARQTARGRAGVHPGQLKRDQRQHQIFGPATKSALLRVKERGRDAALVKVREQCGLVRRPFVRIAAALGDQPRDRPARDVARRLDEHVQLIAVGKAPHDLADIIAGQGLEGSV